MEVERLARVEEKVDFLIELSKVHNSAQERHNQLFYQTRDKVERMEAKHGAMAALAVFLSGLISVIVGFFSHK